MNQITFKNQLRAIFAAHGKAPSEAVVYAVWTRVEPLPDEFMTWAVTKLCDYEKLPPNLGLELEKELFPSWCSQTGKKALRLNAGCHECDIQTPGYFTGWLKGGDGQRKLIRCACNTDEKCSFMRPMTRGAAERNGYHTTPPGKRIVQYEQEVFGNHDAVVRCVNKGIVDKVFDEIPF